VTDSYWLQEASEPLRSRRIEGTPEVVVVGGGISGCSAALTLARAGVKVRVHDARRIAGGASGRNGGFALRGGAMAYDRAHEWVGADAARAVWFATERALDEIEELAGDACARVGSLRLAHGDGEREELLRELEALRADGFAVEWREAEELAAPLERRFSGALYHPRDALLQPARLVRRIAAAAVAAGAEFRECSRVESREQAAAPVILVATDGYPSGLLGELEGLIVPTRGQMLATEPLSELVFPLPHYGRQGFDYWHQDGERRLIVGGFRDVDMSSEFTAEEATTARVQSALEEFVTWLAGGTVEITHRWAGIFGFVPDLLPVAGRVTAEGLWVAGGYSGHGNVLGFLCGRLVARAILGDRDPLLDLFEPARLVAV
jgi:gamma-glutamylputrescine oxidase